MANKYDYHGAATLGVTFQVSQQRLADILTAAVESGVYGSQWLRDFDASAEYGADQDSDDGRAVVTVKLGKADPRSECATDGSADRVKCRRVDLPRVAWALGAMLGHSDETVRDVAAVALGPNLDGPAADCIMQYAVFEAVLFG